MFVRYDCGCVGLKINDPNVRSMDIVIYPCDNRDLDYRMEFRVRHDLSDKKYAILPESDFKKIVSEVNKLIAEGQSLQKVKQILCG